MSEREEYERHIRECQSPTCRRKPPSEPTPAPSRVLAAHLEMMAGECSCSLTYIEPFCKRDLAIFARLVRETRRAAFEEAAKVAEANANRWLNGERPIRSDARADACMTVSAAIRALAGKEAK